MTLYIVKNGQRTGPYTLAEAQTFLANGTFLPSDFAWYEGLADWIPLQQVPGIGSAPAAGVVPTFGTTMASPAQQGPARRPVLVWVICLLYFIFIPLGLVSLAATPYLLSFTTKMQQQVAANLQDQLDRTTDPAQRDQLSTALNQFKTSQAQVAKAMNHGVLYYCLIVFSMTLSLVAAILLFILRRAAFPAFIASFVVSGIMSVYNYATLNLPSGGGSTQTVGMAIGIVAAVIGWGIAIAILYYVWTLWRRNVLR